MLRTEPYTMCTLENNKNVCKCEEPIETKYMIMSLNTLFNILIKQCITEQHMMYNGYTKQGRGYIYINNFCRVVDTVFRLAYKFGNYYKRIVKRFNAKHIVAINDVYEDERELSENETYTHKCLMYKLRAIAKYLDESELEDYDCWEVLLSKMFPECYNFTIHMLYGKKDSKDSSEQEVAEKEFVYVASLTQMRLTRKERLMIKKFMVDMLSMNKFHRLRIIEFHSKRFEFDAVKLVQQHSKERVLMLSETYLPLENVLYLYKNNVYNPCRLHEPCMLFEIKFRNYVSKNMHLIDLFDVCEKECHGKVLDINSIYGLTLFDNIKELIVNCKLVNQNDLLKDYKLHDICSKKVMQTRMIEAEEYAWLSKDDYARVVGTWCRMFNKFSECKMK